jgi:hypothetical protein
MTNPTDTTRVIKIPVVIGPNRLRGKQEGTMFDGDQAVSDIYALIDLEAKENGVTTTPKYRVDTAQQLLREYEKSHRNYMSRAGTRDPGVVGHVYEGSFASGRTLLMADPRIFLRFPSIHKIVDEPAENAAAEAVEAESSFAPAA